MIPFSLIPRLTLSNILVCNSSEAFPSGVATPSLWYKMDAATASTNTANKNTVNGGEYDRFYNFGNSVNVVNLDYTVIGSSLKWKQPTTLQNNLTTAQSRAGQASWMLWSSASGTNFSTAGVGTVVMAWKSSNDTGGLSGNLQFQARNANNQSSGFLSKFGSSSADKTTIFGDNQSYQFTTPVETDCIRIVSVQSAGTPLYYKQNGVQGSTVSYDTMSNQGSTFIASLDQTTNNDISDVYLYEALYFESALSESDCVKIQDYLAKKWCINF